jgi:acyl-CoA reductase-like NAD-dependent aldehyde dehydrogenase
MSRPGSRHLACKSPVDGRIYVERPLADAADLARALDAARGAQPAWQAMPLPERKQLVGAAIDAFVARADEIAGEITWQMGRPISQSAGEVRGFEERARHMVALAEEALAPVLPEPKPGFERWIARVPLGVVFVVAPWNYPYLTAVNAVVPALLAGNAVLLKHSSQTPLCSERFAQAFEAAGLPGGVFHSLHLSHDDTLGAIAGGRIDHVAFTGSVPGGRAVARAAAESFATAGLELGGKDPAYVRADADVEATAASLVDGAFFNSGQSCCGIERIYVHRSLYADFIEAAAAVTREYVLGDPTLPETTLGPMVRPAAADFVRGQTAEAIAAGARAIVPPGTFPPDEPGSAYLAPQILVDVDHRMRVMTEESFGPVVGVMAVDSDDEALALMNDSDFGLTASIWTRDVEAVHQLGPKIATGTVFMNRCDYLDPALAWTGVKDSGYGCTLSRLGFDSLTRPQSFHLKP